MKKCIRKSQEHTSYLLNDINGYINSYGVYKILLNKFLLTITLFLCVSNANASSDKELLDYLNRLSINQKIVMSRVFDKSTKFDLQYTMTAIVWQESNFGLYKINLSDPSCGIFHIMPKSLITRVEIDNTSWNRSRLCERLMEDDDFSFSSALLELKYWQNYWKSKKVPRVWSHMVSSYNAGFKWKNGKNYLYNIKQKIRVLKLYVGTHNK